jgi:FolB domain-containing protein
MLVIYIKDLLVEAKHGVHQREKDTPQPFKFNLAVTLDNSRASVSDDLADTVNYTELKRIITDTAQNNSFNLIEKLAQAIADQILRDKHVQKVTVTIDKPAVFKNGVPGVSLEVKRGLAG